MTEAFELDTSGTVFGCGPDGRVRWPDLSPFDQGFIRAAFATSPLVTKLGPVTATNQRTGMTRPVMLIEGFGLRHLHPATLARFLKDCEAHQSSPVRWIDSEAAGAAWWEGRQAGAWKSYGPIHLSPDPDGKIIIEEPVR